MTNRLARATATILAFCAVLFFAHSAIAQAHPANPPHWSYNGADGPDHWGDLESDYAECKSGHRESPIDIVGAQPADLAPIHFDYKLEPLKVINNGYTIQFNYEAGSSITINGTALPLVQFHFHHVSENEVDGKKYDMELHFVHVDSAANRTAVVAVFIKSGAENAALRDLWSHIPHDMGKEVEYKKVVINAADLLPADQNYYTFDGSLTIPPCKEGIKWFVMKTPIEASPAQIAAFAKYYPTNARPIQPTNGREIHESNFH
ncbi:MAG: carbonic anhydrase family protein [Candidatus Acidiferrales bacterium]|jgi:carbonic anhydrase